MSTPDPTAVIATQARKVLEEAKAYLDMLQAQPNPDEYDAMTQALVVRLPQALMLRAQSDKFLVQWSDCCWCNEERGPSVGGQFVIDVGGWSLPMCKECYNDPLLDRAAYNRDHAIARLLGWYATSQAENKRLEHVLSLRRDT